MTETSQDRSLPGRLTRRADYLAAAKGRRFHTPRLTLQGIERAPEAGDGAGPRFGLTVSRKVGTATERNRVRRRLRAALLRLAEDRPDALAGKDRHDFVVVARRDILSAQFPTLITDIADAVAGLDRPRGKGPRRPDARRHAEPRQDTRAADAPPPLPRDPQSHAG
ncbi:ribonuclease P protein component [Alsobacter soli]|uniref:Ribonuclease P protein component n=1 Tax=Alsobacter soli TaxID=2109933 RepID=A0A2T1HWY0_9HYPH|nr:ribonuclease P protein component [Alsobacter soli]PSC06193.1 ribonuclease P protein component [Alsobacter soli]